MTQTEAAHQHVPVQQYVDGQQLAFSGSQVQCCSAIIVWQVHWHPILHQQADFADIPCTGCLAQCLWSML